MRPVEVAYVPKNTNPGELGLDGKQRPTSLAQVLRLDIGDRLSQMFRLRLTASNVVGPVRFGYSRSFGLGLRKREKGVMAKRA